MPELALHILDLVQNSVSAGATRVVVTICYDTARDTLLISIEDDGKGMPPELLSRVESPFATTRTTRKVGLGIPLFKQLAVRGQAVPHIHRGQGHEDAGDVRRLAHGPAAHGRPQGHV